VPLTRAIEFGVRWTQRDVDRRQYIDPNTHGDNILLTGYSGVYPTSNFGASAFTLPFSQFLFVPISTFESALQTADPAGNASFAPTEFDSLNSYGVREDTFALYIQDDLRTELFNLPLKGNIGLRGVETRTSTTGYYQPFTIVFNQQAVGNLVYTSSEIQSTQFKNSYFNLLPELNLQLDIRDDLLVRFAAGKSMTRPDFQTQLAPALTGRVFVVTDTDFFDSNKPGMKRVRERLERGGVELSPFAVGGALAAQIMIDALRQIDGPINRQSVLAALARISPYDTQGLTAAPYKFTWPDNQRFAAGIHVVVLADHAWRHATEDWTILK